MKEGRKGEKMSNHEMSKRRLCNGGRACVERNKEGMSKVKGTVEGQKDDWEVVLARR